MTKPEVPTSTSRSISAYVGLAIAALMVSACEAAAAPLPPPDASYPGDDLYVPPDVSYPDDDLSVPDDDLYVPPDVSYPDDDLSVPDDEGTDQTSQYETAGLLNALVEDSNRFWVEHTNAVSPIAEVPGTPLAGGTRPFVLGESMCGEIVLGNNSGWYCPTDDRVFINQDYFQSIGTEYGPLPAVYVIGHEWGHAIDRRYGLRNQLDYSRDRELFADCLGGAYVSRIVDGAIAGLEITSADLVAFEQFMIERTGDQEMVDWNTPDSHGSGDFRLDHVRQGFDYGIEGCGVYYESEATPTVDITGLTEQSSAGVLTIATTIDANEFVNEAGTSGNLTVTLFFQDAAGSWIAAPGPDYRTPGGVLAIANRVAATPGTQIVELSIPLDQFPVGTSEVAIRVEVTDGADVLYAQHTSASFTIG